MSRVLVAGAGGFIGGHLVKRLVEDGHEVVAVDIKPLGQWWLFHREARNLRFDLSDSRNCGVALWGPRFDEVYNLACDMGGMGFIEANKTACMLNVLINTNLLRAAIEHDVQRFFFSSTACVYRHDLQQGHAIRLKESDAYPADPEDGYGWEKLFSERMCRHFTEDFGLETRVARYHTIYGPNETWIGGREKVPAAFCRKVLDLVHDLAQDVEVWGDGQQERSFLYVDDCVDATVRLMASDHRDPVNIGSPDSMTISELLTEVERIAQIDVIRRHVDGPLGVRGRSADITRISDVTGWKPQTSLRDGLERTYRWIEQQSRYSSTSMTA